MDSATWMLAINTAGRQRTLSQKMTKEFLWVALEMDALDNKELMLGTMDLFETSLETLKVGNDDGTIPAAPSQAILDAFNAVTAKWLPFKALLADNVDAVRSSNKTANKIIIHEVFVYNLPLLDVSDDAVQQYTMAGHAAGASIAGLVFEVAGRQRMLSQRMSKEAAFIGLNVDEAINLERIATTVALFESSHMDIVRGVGSIAEMPILQDVCTLSKMKEVDGIWRQMMPYTSEIVDEKQANSAGLQKIMELNVPLFNTMNEAVGLYANDMKNSCAELSANVKAQQWMNILAELGNQRTLGQRSLTLLFQAGAGVYAQESRVDAVSSTDAGAVSMRVCIEGSNFLNVPSPPTQEAVNALLLGQTYWQNFATSLSKGLNEADIAKNAQLSIIANYGKTWMVQMDEVAELYVNSSLAQFANLRSVVIEISWRQIILLQQIASNALMASLGQTSEAKATAMLTFSTDVKTFEASHSELLLGRVVSAVSAQADPNATTVLFADRGLPKTTNACMLTLMMTVSTRFANMKKELTKVVDAQHAQLQDSTQRVDADAEREQLLQGTTYRMQTDSAMSDAVAGYESGQRTCHTVISRAEWESGLKLAGDSFAQLQVATKYFTFITSGVAAIWVSSAQAIADSHMGYIRDDRESPVLEQAVTAFKDGWFSMGKDDTERQFALIQAYVNQNPHPIGMKHMLNYAPGNEEYHAAHKEYHPVYRDLMNEREYYDVFIFDLQGNLIYSVFKEPDFATNFDNRGTGEWKDSGLGDAYRAAKVSPDEVTVTPWRPYGPSSGALASFLSMGVKSSMGQLMGVYSTQLPPVANPIDAVKGLEEAIHHLDTYLEQLKFGMTAEKPADKVAPPAAQAIADALFVFENKWVAKKGLLAGPKTVEALGALLAEIPPIVGAAVTLQETFIDEAWIADKTVPAKKISLASLQAAVLQEIMKNVALFAMESQLAQPAVEVQTIKDLMKEYEERHQLLLLGQTTTSRRLAGGGAVTQAPVEDAVLGAKTDIPPSEDPMLVKLMDDASASFAAFKAAVIALVDPAEGEQSTGGTPENLGVLMYLNSEAAGAAGQSLLFIASKMHIVVLEPVSILTPVPLSGDWVAGKTMRVVARVAEELINDAGLILPGYAVTHVFFDDKCDATTSSQIVLREMKSSIAYVGLGGSGCTSVCAGTAFIASSIRLPYLSYECPGVELSDTTEYPELTRFGTVTTSQVILMKQIGETYAKWNHVAVISGDPGRYRKTGEQLVADLEAEGLPASYGFAYEGKWDEIVAMVNGLRILKRRVIYVMGSELYFRNIICAAMVSNANMGITWVTDGSWRQEWWTKSDMMLDSMKLWIKDDSQREIVSAIGDFITGWNEIADTDEARFNILQPLYATDQKDELMFIDGPESYHVVHKKWHPLFRKKMLDQNYYDVFVFDMKGNMIYSVFKELDYATNFGNNKNLGEKFSEWQASGLGDAFREAILVPGDVVVTPWDPYGPSFGALASFLAITVHDAVTGAAKGVFSIQMPPEAVPLEVVEPACTQDAVAEAFEGSLNFVGLGTPVAADMEKQVPCFRGKTAKSFMELLDDYLANGFPAGDPTTAMDDPYNDVRMHTADGTCVFAYTVAHLMETGLTLDDVEAHQEDVYLKFVDYIKTGIDFQGVSGVVNFKGNDKHAHLAIYQVQQGKKTLVGTCSHNNSIDMTINGGPSNVSWKPAHPDIIPQEAEFPYFIFQVLLPILCICCPGLAACIRNF
jgi:hypothetical protein